MYTEKILNQMLKIHSTGTEALERLLLTYLYSVQGSNTTSNSKQPKVPKEEEDKGELTNIETASFCGRFFKYLDEITCTSTLGVTAVSYYLFLRKELYKHMIDLQVVRNLFLHIKAYKTKQHRLLLTLPSHWMKFIFSSG